MVADPGDLQGSKHSEMFLLEEKQISESGSEKNLSASLTQWPS